MCKLVKWSILQKIDGKPQVFRTFYTEEEFSWKLIFDESNNNKSQFIWTQYEIFFKLIDKIYKYTTNRNMKTDTVVVTYKDFAGDNILIDNDLSFYCFMRNVVENLKGPIKINIMKLDGEALDPRALKDICKKCDTRKVCKNCKKDDQIMVEKVEENGLNKKVNLAGHETLNANTMPENKPKTCTNPSIVKNKNNDGKNNETDDTKEAQLVKVNSDTTGRKSNRANLLKMLNHSGENNKESEIHPLTTLLAKRRSLGRHLPMPRPLRSNPK